jgi:MFS family permease
VVFVTGIGMFGIFLFLTYYLQQNLGFTPIKSGLAFLPMIAALILTATTSTSVILPRYGARWSVALGMIVAAVGIGLLAQLDVGSTYASNVLPGLIVTGLGLGATIAPAMQGAVTAVSADDAGVASATVNTMQQVGGSVGTALLSTIASNALNNYVSNNPPKSQAAAMQVMQAASVHSYTTAFWWSAVVFAVGGVLAGAVIKGGKLPEAPDGATTVHA